MAELGAFVLPVVPLLLLVVCLLFGRYPGYEAIIRLSEQIASWAGPRHAPAGHHRPPLRSRSFAPSGGLLLALSLSGRAPPA